MSLLEKMLKTKAKGVDTYKAQESELMKVPEHLRVNTNLPMFNLAQSGNPLKGFLPGIYLLAGESGTGKTLLSWLAAGAFQRKFPDGIVLFYDSEQGTPDDYLDSLGIDTDRVVHIPVLDLEELKFDMVAKLKEIDKDEKVFILVDSLGNIASKKEVEDAENEKSVADMSRAKSAKSFFRMVTPIINRKQAYMFGIQHVYSEIGLFPKTIVSGGNGAIFASNSIITLTKSQEKEGSDLAGVNLNLGIYKSRYVREKLRLRTTLLYEGGFKTYSGFGDVLLKLGILQSPKKGWYQIVDEDGVVNEEKSYRMKQIESKDIMLPLLKQDYVIDAIEKHYKLAGVGKVTLNDDFNLDEIDE